MSIELFLEGDSRIMARLAEMETHLMSVITDFKTSVEASFAKIGTDLTTLKTGIANQATQIAALQAQLAASGTLSADDMAAVNQVQSDAAALASTADGIANPTPPVTPVTPTSETAPAGS